jgi:hypothetical protein
MSNWLYKTSPIEDLSQFPSPTYGFIYKITHLPSGKSYIGKKVLYHNKKVKLGKKELALHEGVGRKPSSKIVTSESDWKKYWGYRVLETPDLYFNDNILGKFFRKDFDI